MRKYSALNKKPIPVNEAQSDLSETLFDEILKDYKDKDFSIKKFCMNHCANPSTVSEKFTSHYGTNPEKFLENLRLEDYIFLFYQKERTRGEAAAQSGFGNARRVRNVIKKRNLFPPDALKIAFEFNPKINKFVARFIGDIWKGKRHKALESPWKLHRERYKQKK
jgi:AraC-like DNA-binding protein